MKALIVLLSLYILSISFISAQDRNPGPLTEVELDNILNPDAIQEYDPFVDEVINQVILDSLVKHVRVLSGEDSVRINGSVVNIQLRTNSDNENAASYVRNKLKSYNLEVSEQSFNEAGLNIIGVQPGVSYPEQLYIICAHYDAVDRYCADDNASGVAAVLEAARILSRYKLEYTLVYALWDQEEIGYVGSKYFAEQARANNTDILGVLNIDMIGWDWDDNGLFDIHSSETGNSETLANLLLTNNELYGMNLNPLVHNPGTELSDHASFWENEYGAILLIESYWGGDFNPYYHTENDRIEEFSLPYFHKMSKLAISTISTLVQIEEEALTNVTGFVIPGESTDSTIHPRYKLSLYPNPGLDLLNIETNIQGPYSIDISALNGQRIFGKEMEGPIHHLDLSSFTEGIYFITIRSAEFVTTRKIVKLSD